MSNTALDMDSRIRARQRIIDLCHSLKIGQCWCFHRFDIEDCFSGGPLDDYADDAREDLLNNLVGSAWGCFTVTVNPDSRGYQLCRHEEGDERVYQEKDRR